MAGNAGANAAGKLVDRIGRRGLRSTAGKRVPARTEAGDAHYHRIEPAPGGMCGSVAISSNY